MPDWIRERFEPLLLLGGDRIRDVGNLVKLVRTRRELR